MWLVCGKCRSTWCKCHLSHDFFFACCPWYVYVGQQTAQSSIKLYAQTNISMLWFSLYGTTVLLVDYRKVLTYLSFALNQGWHKDGHLVRVWQWKTLDSSVTHIEAKRSLSYIQFHSTERNLLLSKSDTSSCAVLQCTAWRAPPAQIEFKLRLTVSADRQPF